MKHDLKHNQFHYFEKQQLEDYLNDMAKKGKYLTKINSQYLVFKSEPIHHIYYFVDVYSQKDGFVDVPQKEEYFEYFQSSGYELLDYCEPFYILLAFRINLFIPMKASKKSFVKHHIDIYCQNYS